MNPSACAYTAFFLGIATNGVVAAAPIIYTDEAAFRTAAGSTTTYGFETHAVTEGTNLPSPVPAADLSFAFELGHAGLNLLEIDESGASPFVVEGTFPVDALVGRCRELRADLLEFRRREQFHHRLRPYRDGLRE